MPDIEIRRAWDGGPLRQWSRYGKGRYVCDKCGKPTKGVWRVQEPRKWLCQLCRDLRTK